MAQECRRFIGLTAVQTISKCDRSGGSGSRESGAGNNGVKTSMATALCLANRKTSHLYTADPTPPRFCEVDGAVLGCNPHG